MAVVGKGNRRQRHAVRGVCVSADRLTQHVHHPVRALAAGDQSVERPGSRPHNVTARLVILHILIRYARRGEQTAHKSFRDVVGSVVVFARKILLAYVVEYVVYARHHLIVGKSERKFGIEDREFGHYFRAEDVPHFHPSIGVGDNAAAVHLAARAHHGKHTAYGNYFAVRLFEFHIIFVPYVAFAVYGNGHRFGVVAYASAAYRKQKVRLVFARNIHAFKQFFIGGVGHNAGNLRHVFAAVF